MNAVNVKQNRLASGSVGIETWFTDRVEMDKRGLPMLQKTVVSVQVRRAFMMAVGTGRIQKIMK